MRANKFELDLRDHIAFYIGEGGQKLGEGSLKWLARDQRLKDLLFVLAQKASVKMQPMLKEALCVATSAKKRKHEETAREKELYGGLGRRKRTKVDMINEFAEHVLDRSPATEVSEEGHITTEIDTHISYRMARVRPMPLATVKTKMRMQKIKMTKRARRLAVREPMEACIQKMIWR